MLKGYTELEEHLATGVQNDVPKKGLDQKWLRNKTGLKGGTLSHIHRLKRQARAVLLMQYLVTISDPLVLSSPSNPY